MDIKALFYDFLNSLGKNTDQDKKLLESVKEGFEACYESEGTENVATDTEPSKINLRLPEDWSKAPDQHPDEGKKPTLGDIYVVLNGQPTSIDVFVDDFTTGYEPEDRETGIHAGHHVEDYKAHANIWLLDENEDRTSTVTTIPDSKFKEVEIPGQYPKTLDELVTDYLNSQIDKHPPEPEPPEPDDDWE